MPGWIYFAFINSKIEDVIEILWGGGTYSQAYYHYKKKLHPNYKKNELEHSA